MTRDHKEWTEHDGKHRDIKHTRQRHRCSTHKTENLSFSHQLRFNRLLTDIIFSKELHSHNSKYEDNNAQYKGQIT